MPVEQIVTIEPKLFKLSRKEDKSGVSGVGTVAFGVMFSDRSAAVHWNTTVSSTTVYRDIDDVVRIHGHDGATELVWLEHHG